MPPDLHERSTISFLPVLLLLVLLGLVLLSVPALQAKTRPHTVGLGAGKRVPYSSTGDPAGAQPGETSLRVRPLVVDDQVKEWTTGDIHDVTDRTFVVRRALRLNDALPGEKTEHWIWQRGPWITIDRSNGHVVALRLPDYDPSVSDVIWFRDYAAYCGLTSGGRQLYAVVAQLAARKPLLAKKLGPWSPGDSTGAACTPAVWQREPLRVTFQPSGTAAMNYDLVGFSAVLVEDGDEGEDTAGGTAH